MSPELNLSTHLKRKEKYMDRLQIESRFYPRARRIVFEDAEWLRGRFGHEAVYPGHALLAILTTPNSSTPAKERLINLGFQASDVSRFVSDGYEQRSEEPWYEYSTLYSDMIQALIEETPVHALIDVGDVLRGAVSSNDSVLDTIIRSMNYDPTNFCDTYLEAPIFKKNSHLKPSSK